MMAVTAGTGNRTDVLRFHCTLSSSADLMISSLRVLLYLFMRKLLSSTADMRHVHITPCQHTQHTSNITKLNMNSFPSQNKH